MRTDTWEGYMCLRMYKARVYSTITSSYWNERKQRRLFNDYKMVRMNVGVVLLRLCAVFSMFQLALDLK